MNKVKFFIGIFIIILFYCNFILAHQGRTDSNGGHYNRSTGEYHYHHGYTAHQHTDGICPYVKKEANSNNYNKSNTDKKEASNADKEETIEIDISSSNNYSKNTIIFTNNECKILTFFTYVLCILIATLLCYSFKYFNDTIKGFCNYFSFLILIISFFTFFETFTQIFDSYKYNEMEKLIVPCLSMILTIFSAYISKKNLN